MGENDSAAGIEQPRDDLELDEDTLSEVIMAVNMLPNGTVGCAYYVARVEKLYFMEDVRSGGPDIVDACQSFVPHHVYALLMHSSKTLHRSYRGTSVQQM